MAIYMKYGSLKGPVTTKGFEGCFELSTMRFGLGRAFDSAARNTEPDKRKTSEPNLSEIMVTKPFDSTSDILFKESCAGPKNNDCTISVTQQSTNTTAPPDTTLSYELKNAGISSYVCDVKGDQLTETLTINFSKLTVNVPKTSGHGSIDLSTMTVS